MCISSLAAAKSPENLCSEMVKGLYFYKRGKARGLKAPQFLGRIIACGSL